MLDSVTLLNNSFKGRTTVAFSGTFGLGVGLNNVVKGRPLEISYRLFCSAKGKMQKNKNQLLNALETGTTYAHALVASITV